MFAKVDLQEVEPHVLVSCFVEWIFFFSFFFKNALALPARFAIVFDKTGPTWYCTKIQIVVIFSRQLPLSMPVVQEPLNNFYWSSWNYYACLIFP